MNVGVRGVVVFVTLLCVGLGQFENKIHQCWIIETVRQGEERCI